jgi:tripartite-type tricarboxylate transporter receptor subunit TctC
MFRRTVLAATAAMTVAAGLPAVAHAKDAWPVKTITLVQPYAPGGTSDMLARIVALELEKRIQASVIVESKPGANGNIATAYVSRAKPDGGTFLVGSSSPVVISPSLYKSVPYNPRTDLTPITPIAKAPFLLVTGATSGINSVDELVAQIKQDKLNFGSAGAGSPQHMIAEMSDADAKQLLDTGILEPDTVLHCLVVRDPGAGTDTYGAIAFVDYADAHYQVSRFATKNRAPNFYR